MLKRITEQGKLLLNSFTNVILILLGDFDSTILQLTSLPNESTIRRNSVNLFPSHSI